MRAARTILAVVTMSVLVASCSSEPTAPSAVPTNPAPARESSATPADENESPKTGSAGFEPTSVDLALDEFASDLDAPVALTHAGDGSGRLFVAEQGGRIVSLNADGDPTPFLDVSSLIVSGGERGLLGLAFHPEFEENGRFFVNYTDTAGDTVIAEYQATPSDTLQADASSARVLLRVDQPYSNHNGGHLEFGPDGYLYIALGDGGSAGDPHENGQDLSTLLGKILRIDVDEQSEGDYGVPPDNPFVGETDARPEIWAFGLRNPWRFSFDRATGQMWIGDVGQVTLEEIDRARAGEGGLNFGWNDMEGSACYEPADDCARDGRVLPITEYAHDFGCSVTGGHVYRGDKEPSLVGGYFFGDYCSGTIWAVAEDAPVGSPPIEMLQTEASISSFGEDEAGELYLTDLSSGSVFRLLQR